MIPFFFFFLLGTGNPRISPVAKSGLMGWWSAQVRK
jgi:hypothetical protein